MLSGNELGNAWIYKLLPELVESEDEKIRKALVDYFTAYKEQKECGIKTFYGIPTDRIIAWLEKQGENNMGISEAAKQKLDTNLNKALEKETPESWNEFIEKQGKQEPADKVEPKFKVGDRVRYKWHACDGIITEITDTDYICGNAKLPISTQDKIELVEHITWSEEDKQWWKVITQTGLTEAALDWIRNLIKRATLQPKQEWSEEDYNEIETIACHLDNMGNEGMAEILRNIIDKYYHILDC